MRSVPLALLALLLVTAGCEETIDEAYHSVCRENVPDSTTLSTFTGVEGSVYRLGSCGTNYCTRFGQGRVVVYPAGSTTAVENQYFYETFRIALAPGRYDVVIAFAGAEADRSLSGVIIAAGRGRKVERNYWEAYDARLLSLTFAADAASQKATVLAQLGVTEVPLTTPPASFPEVRVSLPFQGHPQLTGERAVAECPGVVVGFQLNPLCGAGTWVPTASATEPDGGHHSDWD